jgi:hypothetical protein
MSSNGFSVESHLVKIKDEKRFDEGLLVLWFF